MTQAIVVEGLRKKFGTREVLHGVDFAVERGTVFGVIGPNGAGKTTTMRCLLDIIRPSAGTISVLGQNPQRAGTALRRRIGYLPGEVQLENRTTGRRMLEHFAAISGPVEPRHVNELAERLNLDLDRQTRKLSKGNKQKLGLLQAFMHRPELLVLDEPTSGLDPLVQQVFHSMVREAVDHGATVFLSSHVLSEVQQAADAVAILRDGEIITVSTVEKLRTAAVRQLRFNSTGTAANDVGALLARVPGVANVAVRELPADGHATGTVEATATLSGKVQPLVQALARLDLTDLVLEEPDLEEAVLTLYTGSTPDQPANGSQRRAAHSEGAHRA
ncbi:ABC transporter ATP-binding protein [Paenarthrobacter nitroguajacolicus]|uniref:ABC transporter ATP-binding protein n=1 Tax=Paenarthrobacter nitroguajacolicus TaxID=211146 RepID=A0A558H933_PAENT|nr:ABC transporter ATP-binding protein [Paenarthrobacter nitroguajacolicus]TVU65645.1 ABC transporter ATP-binding protein [Paenarthrobacter nitroguajacolicus]